MRPLLRALPVLLAALAHAADIERPPAVAGRFYPEHPELLARQVRELIHKGRPPKVDGEIVALLVPHAGLEFSGEAAATAFNALPKDAVDAFVLVGTGHHFRFEGAALFPGAFTFPGGRVGYDAKLAQALLKASPLIQALPEAHEKEHSIEVNVPLVAARFPKAKLVGLVMNSEDLAVAEAVGAAIAKAVKGRRAVVAASSDLSHYPPGHLADKVDKSTLHALAMLDPGYFWTVNRYFMTRKIPEFQCAYCGEGAVTTVLAAAKALGATRMQLLRRYNSGDAVSEHDYRHVVGYAAAAFVKDAKASPPAAIPLSEEERKTLLAEARASLERRLSGEAAPPEELSDAPAFNLPAAVFVSLYDPAGSLRGCMGSSEPQASLVESVRGYASMAGLEDSRFEPITAEELPRLRLEVSVLSPARPVKGPGEIRPKEHGVALELDGKRGVFLPQVWKQLPDKKEFLGELCAQKAGLPRDCAYRADAVLKVFTASDFAER